MLCADADHFRSLLYQAQAELRAAHHRGDLIMAGRLDDIPCYVAVCNSTLYGTFHSRPEADAWMEAFVGSTGEPGVTYEWDVSPVVSPADAVGLADQAAQAGS